MFTGDLVYKDRLFAYYPSTDPESYLASLEKIVRLVEPTMGQEQTMMGENTIRNRGNTSREALSAAGKNIVEEKSETPTISKVQIVSEKEMPSTGDEEDKGQKAKVFPAHHSLDIRPEIVIRMRDAFRQLKADGKLHHGSGVFEYGDWSVWL